jgi:serine protease Do
MQRFAILLVVGFWCGRANWAAAQPALERLENQVRNRGAAGAEPEGQADAPADNTGYLGVVADDRTESGKGVRIMEVVRGSPAEKSGLRADDLVTAVAGKPVKTMEDFARVLGPAPVGSQLLFEIKRDRKPQQLEVTLGRRPPREERPFSDFGPIPETAPSAEAPPSGAGAMPRPGLLGVRVEAVTAEARAELDLPSSDGAMIVHVNPGSPGERAGLPVQGVIVAVDEKQVANPGDLKRLIARAGAGANVKITYYFDGKLNERTVRLASPALAAEVPFAGPYRLPPEAPIRSTESSADARVELLEQRIEMLERRLAQLERLLRAGKNDSELPPPEEQ